MKFNVSIITRPRCTRAPTAEITVCIFQREIQQPSVFPRCIREHAGILRSIKGKCRGTASSCRRTRNARPSPRKIRKPRNCKRRTTRGVYLPASLRFPAAFCRYYGTRREQSATPSAASVCSTAPVERVQPTRYQTAEKPTSCGRSVIGDTTSSERRGSSIELPLAD